jgi:hypothetical protein
VGSAQLAALVKRTTPEEKGGATGMVSHAADSFDRSGTIYLEEEPADGIVFVQHLSA